MHSPKRYTPSKSGSSKGRPSSTLSLWCSMANLKDSPLFRVRKSTFVWVAIVLIVLRGLSPPASQRSRDGMAWLSNQIPAEDIEAIDVVYVYCNKSNEIVYKEYHQAAKETSGKVGYKRSPPSKGASEDLDTMELSVKMTAKMGKNLGTIYILVTHPEEVNDEITNMPNVKVIPSSVVGADIQFSSLRSEAVVHKIPNLSTLYVAMNDDMIITKPVDFKTFFFTPIGSPRCFSGEDPSAESWKHFMHRISQSLQHPGKGAMTHVKYTVARLDSLYQQHAAPHRIGIRTLFKGVYPTHAPRPFNKRFINLVEQMDPELFQTPFGTRFRCQNCLSVNIISLLHSIEVGALRKTTDRGPQYTLLAYVDSPRVWNDVVQKWDSISFLTLQEVEPELHSQVQSFLENKLRDNLDI